MEWSDLVPRELREAWGVASGTATPVTATPHGAYNTPQDANKSHADVTMYRYPNGEPAGVSTGIGAWDGPLPHADPDTQLRLLDGHVDLGRHKDRDGGDAYGVNADFGLNEVKTKNGELGTLSGSARAVVTGKGAEVGLQADGPQGAWSRHEQGTASDEHKRFGFSPFGPGASARLHWADEDGDGHREWGFGADIGDFSFDFTTEDPLRSLVRSATFERYGGRMGESAKDDSNWTDGSIHAVSNLFGHMAE